VGCGSNAETEETLGKLEPAALATHAATIITKLEDSD
jgi:hypothetical protein